MLAVLHIESVRSGFYTIAIVLFLIFISMMLMTILFAVIDRKSLFSNTDMIFGNIVIVFIGLVLPAIISIYAHRFPSAPRVQFNCETQTVTWQSGPNELEISYDKIAFEKKMFLVKTGTASHSVLIRAISTTPFSTADKPEEDARQLYIKDLCMYNAGTSEEADESIEIIKLFMAGKYDDSPSKFDTI